MEYEPCALPCLSIESLKGNKLTVLVHNPGVFLYGLNGMGGWDGTCGLRVLYPLSEGLKNTSIFFS